MTGSCGPEPERERLVVGRVEVAELEVRDEEEASSQQLERPVAQSRRALQHLVGIPQPIRRMVGTRLHIAECSERLNDRSVVGCGPGEGDRLPSQRAALPLGVHHRERDRETRRDERAQHRFLSRQRRVRFPQEIDLLPVEHVDLEAGGPGAQAQRGAGKERREGHFPCERRDTRELHARCAAIATPEVRFA